MALFDYLTITLLIILFTVLVSYQGFTNYHMVDRWKHYPYRESRSKEWYRILTSGFVHADWTHLLVNMFVLYSFGGLIENYIIADFGTQVGRVIFLVLYILNIIFANIPTYFKHKNNPSFSSIGASGTVSGIVFI